MKLVVITGTCGAGKSTIKDELEQRLDSRQFACIDTDEVGINWWDYAGTDHEHRFSDDCLGEAVRRADGRDLVFASCLNPQDYIGKHTIPEDIESTYFIVLCPTDEKIEQRLRARPKERGFDSDEAIRPQIAYNQWFRKNKGKFPLFIDNSNMSAAETAEKIVSFITSLPMNDKLTRIRESEKKSHTATYTNEKLYDKTGWLQKPIKTVLDILPLFHAYTELRVLDLGCGIGRNSICIAETYQNIKCTVDCVDLLEIALEKLKQNAKKYGVSEIINEILRPIEEYKIRSNFYDLIMAVSALEHIDSEKSFVRKLAEIKNGVKENGIVCLVINSNVRETNASTKEILEPQFEVNLPTKKLQLLLEDIFSDWRVLKTSVTAQEYDIPRDNIISHLETNVVTYVAQRAGHKNQILNK